MRLRRPATTGQAGQSPPRTRTTPKVSTYFRRSGRASPNIGVPKDPGVAPPLSAFCPADQVYPPKLGEYLERRATSPGHDGR